MNEPAAIITGAGSGIGRAIAVELSGSGYRCLLVGRTRSTLDQTAKQCAGAGVCVDDVTDPKAAKRIVAAALEQFGRIDVLVNNAGYAPVVPIEAITSEHWRQIIDTNLSAAVYLAHAAWGTFAAQKSGVVVNISSESSRDPFLGLGAYGAAKAGLNLLTMALAEEGRPINLRCYAIAPAAVETAMLRKIVSVGKLPTEQTLAPEQIARAVLQCISGDFRHANGEVIYLHKG